MQCVLNLRLPLDCPARLAIADLDIAFRIVAYPRHLHAQPAGGLLKRECLAMLECLSQVGRQHDRLAANQQRLGHITCLAIGGSLA